jgi:hypothetical protein
MGAQPLGRPHFPPDLVPLRFEYLSTCDYPFPLLEKQINARSTRQVT